MLKFLKEKKKLLDHWFCNVFLSWLSIMFIKSRQPWFIGSNRQSTEWEGSIFLSNLLEGNFVIPCISTKIEWMGWSFHSPAAPQSLQIYNAFIRWKKLPWRENSFSGNGVLVILHTWMFKKSCQKTRENACNILYHKYMNTSQGV